MSDPIEGDIAGDHPHNADGQRDPPPEDRLMRQDPAGDDRELLGDRDAKTSEEENEK
jgi:hypothetical protein